MPVVRRVVVEVPQLAVEALRLVVEAPQLAVEALQPELVVR